MPQLHTLDYILLAAYLVLMAGIGSFFGWFVKDAAGYLKGGNTIPWAVAGVSNFMSMFSTYVFVANAGIAYEHGLIAVVVFWAAVPPGLVAARFLAARWRRANLTTPVEYLERRFNLGVRQVFSWMGLLMRFLDNAVRLYALGLFLATVTPLSLGEAIVTSGLFITLFTMIGGLWAVAVMDTIQFLVLMCATAILVPVCLDAVGGLAGIAAVAPGHLDWFNGPKGAPLWLLSYYLLVTLKYNSNWSFIQRLYIVKDEAGARKVGYLTAFLFLAAPVMFLLPAVAARALVPGLENPEQAYVAVCVRLLPAGMMGMMIASMFSATMSALNSEFNVMAAVITNDFYRRFLSPGADDRHLMFMARLTTVCIGVSITGGALFVGALGGAFEANKLFASVLGIPLAIPLIFGLVWRRPSAAGALLCTLGGFAVAGVLHFSDWLPWEIATLAVILICVALFALPGRQRAAAAGDTKTAAFFTQLGQPLRPDQIPKLDPRFSSALARLFGFSFLVAGGLFVLVSLVSLSTLSGLLALGAGAACSIFGVLALKFKRPAVAGH